MKSLYLCCEKSILPKMTDRARKAFGQSFEVVHDMKQADLAYVVGEVTPEMQSEMVDLKKNGIKMVKVNENLIDMELKEKLLNGQIHVKKREMEMER